MRLTSEQVLDAMVFVSDHPHLRPYAAEGRLLRIDRGAYLDPSVFSPGTEPWEIDRAVTLARAHALSRRARTRDDCASSHTPVLTGEPALIATGAEVWNQNPPITYRDSVQVGKRNAFPAVVIDARAVAARPAKAVGTSKSSLRDAQTHQGLLLAEPDTLVWDQEPHCTPRRPTPTCPCFWETPWGFPIDLRTHRGKWRRT